MQRVLITVKTCWKYEMPKEMTAQFKKAVRANRRFSAARMVLRHFVTKTNQTFEILIDFKSE